MGAQIVDQSCRHCVAGSILGVNDSPATVPAFAGQVITIIAAGMPVFLMAREGHALVDKPLNGTATVFDGKTHCCFIAQARARAQRIIAMRFNTVGSIENRCNATLGIAGGAFVQFGLGNNGDFSVAGQSQRDGRSGGSATDYDYVVLAGYIHYRVY